MIKVMTITRIVAVVIIIGILGGCGVIEVTHPEPEPPEEKPPEPPPPPPPPPPLCGRDDDGTYMNFQELATYYSKADGNYYLILLSIHESTDSKHFFHEYDKLQIIVDKQSKDKAIIERSDFDILNLGRFMRKEPGDPTLFKFSLVIDTSGSINDASLQIVEKALTQFIENLPEVFEGQIIKFSDTVKPLGFTNDKQQLLAQVKETPVERGGTALFDAIDMAVQELNSSFDNIPLKFAVVMTDGKETASQGEYSKRNQEAFRNDIISKTKKANIPLFIVGVTSNVDEKLLEDITRFGLYEHADNFPDLDRAFSIINGMIVNTYIFRIRNSQSQLADACRLLIVTTQGRRLQTIQDISIR